MLPGTGYYKALNCPFYEMGFCERPYCHFKHSKKQEPSEVQDTATVESKPAIKEEPLEQSSSVAQEALVPESPVAPSSVATGVGQNLELLVQEAVKKVLLGGGANTAALLGGLDTSSILANLNIKKEKPEDDDSDCVIEEEIPAKIVFDKSKVKSEKEEKTALPEAPITPKPKLYLPPEGCQAYNPTPIKDLEKRAEEVHLDKPSTSYRPNVSLEKPKTNISPSLIQASSLHNNRSIAVPKAKSSKPKFSYTPTKESVLGDVGDLSDSEEEKFETPDILGNILKAGNKSGVLIGGVVSEFEERVISERLKLLRKKSDKSDQCDKITSSSPNQDEVDDDGVEEKVEDNERLPPEETEEEKAERKLREKEQEIQKLEEKRLLLENYYKAKLEEKKKRGAEVEERRVQGEKKEKITNSERKEDMTTERKKVSDSKNRSSCGKDRHREKSSSERSTRKKKSDGDRKSRGRHKSKKHKSRKHSTESDSSDYSSHDSSSDSESDTSTSSSAESVSKNHKSRSRSKHKKHGKSSKQKKKDRSRKRSGKHKKKSRSRSSTESTSSDSESRKSNQKKEKRIKDNLNGKEDPESHNHIESSEVIEPKEVSVKNELQSPIVDNNDGVSGDKVTDANDTFRSTEEELKKLLANRNSIVDVESTISSEVQAPPAAEEPKLKIKCMGQLIARNTKETFSTPGLDHDVFENVADIEIGDFNDDCINANQDHDFSDGDFEADTGKSFLSALDEVAMATMSPKKSSNTLEQNSKTMDHKGSSSHLQKTESSSNHKSGSSHKSSSSNDIKSSSSSSHKSSRSSHKSSSQDKSKSSHKSSRHKSSSSHHKSSSSHHKSSSSHHKSSSSHKSESLSHHGSSSSREKSKKRERSRDRERSKERREKSSSERKSSSKKQKTDTDCPFDKLVKKTVASSEHNNEDVYNREDSKSPLPDFTEELALLPDDISAEMITADDIGEDYDNVADGLEDIFAGVEEDGDDELQRIFYQYEPEVNKEDPSLRKQKQLEEKARSTSEAADTLVAGKKRQAYQGSEDQAKEKRPLHMKKPAMRTPAQAMFDRYKKLQEMKQQQLIEKRMTEITEDDTEEKAHASSSFSLAPKKSRVAHQGGGQPPVVLSKTKQQLLAREKAKEVLAKSKEKTVAVTNAKGSNRVAHTPTTVHITRPMVTPDPKSKVPTNIRQRYLNSIIDECLKITGGEELEAFTRAEKEEADCCRKASSRMIYLNLVVNCIKKLRSEAAMAAKAKKSSANPTSGKRSLLTTHMQVLAGKPGSVGTWSIEKPTQLTTEDIDENLLFAVMKKYVMTEEQLVDNGFPRADSEEPGRAVIKQEERRKKIDPEKAKIVAADEHKRLCDRCNTIYKVDDEGMQIDKEDCVHHWGRLFRRRMNRVMGPTSLWNCCDGTAESDGCQVAKAHVTDTLDYNNIRGFVSTIDRNGPGHVFALDCEMCNTTKGNELTRVTVIDYTGETCYESLVKPDNPIVDYNTRFSGITAEDMVGVTTNIRDVQAHLLLKFEAKDILIGHSLESDMRALKLIHSTVVDTSVVFPHKMGPPFKRALKTLAAEQIQRIIQNGVDGHDSKEDALACLDLMKQKVTGDVSKLQSQVRANNSSKRRDAYLTDPDSVKLT